MTDFGGRVLDWGYTGSNLLGKREMKGVLEIKKLTYIPVGLLKSY